MSDPRQDWASTSKRVLLVRLGSLGDIVHALPTLATLKENFPGWELDWLVERRWRDLLHGNPCLTRIVEFDTLKWRTSPLATASWNEITSALRNLRERRYDFAIDLQGAIKSAVACRLSGARQVIGLERPWLREPAASVLYSRRISSDAVHIVDANLALAAAVGARSRLIQFPLPPGDDSALSSDLRQGAFAVINPGAGWVAKQWPASCYAELCDALLERYGLAVVINYGPGEGPLSDAVRGACRRARPETFSGSLLGLIAVLHRTELVIAPDTGPLHLAAALGVPTVALFGPTDPRRNGPYGNSHRNLRAAEAVTSHSRSGRPSGAMERIRPDQVLEAVGELLKQREKLSARPASVPK